MSLYPSLPPRIARTCRLFWCYQCHRSVRIISSPSSDVFCPRCYGQFLHEIDLPRPLMLDLTTLHPLPCPHHHHHPFPGFPPPPPPPPFLSPPDATRNRPGSWVIFGRTSDDAPDRARSPPIAPAPPEHSVPPAVHPGDYFVGPGLNELIGELTQNDRPGLPPAPTSAIDAMPSVRITAAHLADGSQCSVCKEEFVVGEEAKEMPCKHVYHSECIVPWLRIHNSCPVCRSQLPVGADEEERINGESSGGSGGWDRRPTRWNPFSSMRHIRAPNWDYQHRSRREAEDDNHDTARGDAEELEEVIGGNFTIEGNKQISALDYKDKLWIQGETSRASHQWTSLQYC